MPLVNAKCHPRRGEPLPRALGCRSLSRLPRTALMWRSRFTSWWVKSCILLRGALVRCPYLELTRSVSRFERCAILARLQHYRPLMLKQRLKWCGRIVFNPISRLTCVSAPGLVRALRRQSGFHEMGHRVHHDDQQLHGVWQHRRQSRQQSTRWRLFWKYSHVHRWLRVYCSCS